MKRLIIIIALLCSGCSMFLRYQYQVALRNLPPNTRVVDIDNAYITYETYTTNHLDGKLVTVGGKQYTTTNGTHFTPYEVVTVNVYKAQYAADGVIIKTTKLK